MKSPEKSGGGGSLLAARSKGFGGSIDVWKDRCIEVWRSKHKFLLTYSPTNLLTSRAFTLAEVVVVMGILTVMMAAFAPVLTKKTINPGGDKRITFDIMPTHNGIYYGSQTDTKPVVIGDNKTDATMAFSPKLLIVSNNTKDATKASPHIAFASKIGDNALTYTGQLLMDPTPAGTNTDTAGNLILGGKYNQDYPIKSSTFYGNTIVGMNAEPTSGSCITAVGAGVSVSTNEATAVGYDTEALDYAVAIGSRSVASASGIAIGGPANAARDYSIAIGSYAQAISGIAIGKQARAEMYGMAIGENATAGMSALAIGRNAKCLSSNGIGIGGSSTTYTTSKINFGNQTLDALITSVTSDRRLKNVGEEYVGGLEELSKLKFYNYTLKDDEKKTPQVGVIAQDLKKVLPNAVFKDSDGYLKVRRDHLFFASLNAIKTLFNRITELEKRNAELEKRLERLEKMMSE